jgi:hypothetical protein
MLLFNRLNAIQIMSIELFAVGVLRSIIEVALLSLLGQGMVGFLARASRTKNPIYSLFLIVGRPPIRMMRFIAPKAILDKHIPFLTFFTLFWLWIMLAYLKLSLCQMSGVLC